MTTDNFTPVTDHTKDRIWEEMFDLQRYIQYYSMQSNRLSFLSKLLRVLLLVGAGLVAGSGFQALHPAVGAGGAVIILALTVIDYVFDWGARAGAGTCHQPRVLCNRKGLRRPLDSSQDRPNQRN